MNLSDLLVALSGNKNLYVSLLDSTDNPIITFDAAGYEAVESDLGTRVVKRIKINSPTSVSVSLEDANP